MTDETERFVGIDVGKAYLEVASYGSETGWRVANDGDGIAKLLPRLQSLSPTIIVVEATGGLELPMVASLAAAGLPVAVVNPTRVRHFARAAGKLAKIGRASCRERV